MEQSLSYLKHAKETAVSPYSKSSVGQTPGDFGHPFQRHQSHLELSTHDHSTEDLIGARQDLQLRIPVWSPIAERTFGKNRGRMASTFWCLALFWQRRLESIFYFFSYGHN